MIRIVRYTAVVLATLGGLLLAWQFRAAGLLFLLALATSATLTPLVETLVQRQFPRSIALPFTYLFVVLCLVLGLILIGGPLFQEIQQASNDFVIAYERVKTEWPRSGNTPQRILAAQLPPIQELSVILTGEQGARIVQAILGVATNFVGLISQLSVILILSLYWSAQAAHFERLWLSLLPVGARAPTRNIWRDIEHNVGAYIQNQTLQSLLAGLLLGTIYWAIGLKYITLLALVVALLRLIPWLGSILAVLPPLLVGLGINPLQGLLAGAATYLVLFAIEAVIRPRFFPDRHYSSLLLVLVTIMLTDAFGLVGLVLAPVLSVTLEILGGHWLQLVRSPSGEQTAHQLSELQSRYQAIRDSLGAVPVPPPPELASLLDRFSQLIEKAQNLQIPPS